MKFKSHKTYYIKYQDQHIQNKNMEIQAEITELQ